MLGATAKLSLLDNSDFSIEVIGWDDKLKTVFELFGLDKLINLENRDRISMSLISVLKIFEDLKIRYPIKESPI